MSHPLGCRLSFLLTFFPRQINPRLPSESLSPSHLTNQDQVLHPLPTPLHPLLSSHPHPLYPNSLPKSPPSFLPATLAPNQFFNSCNRQFFRYLFRHRPITHYLKPEPKTFALFFSAMIADSWILKSLIHLAPVALVSMVQSTQQPLAPQLQSHP